MYHAITETLSIIFPKRYAKVHLEQNTQNHCIQRPTMQIGRAFHLPLLVFFPFFPCIMPSNFLLKASLTLLCPAHSLLIRFIRQLAMTMKATARNEGLFGESLPILPRTLSPRRRRGDDGVGVMPISERRLRSTWLL